MCPTGPIVERDAGKGWWAEACEEAVLGRSSGVGVMSVYALIGLSIQRTHLPEGRREAIDAAIPRYARDRLGPDAVVPLPTHAPFFGGLQETQCSKVSICPGKLTDGTQNAGCLMPERVSGISLLLNQCNSQLMQMRATYLLCQPCFADGRSENVKERSKVVSLEKELDAPRQNRRPGCHVLAA